MIQCAKVRDLIFHLSPELNKWYSHHISLQYIFLPLLPLVFLSFTFLLFSIKQMTLEKGLLLILKHYIFLCNLIN